MTGERIKQIRRHLGLSQQEFAAALKVNPSAVSQMESDRIRPSLDTIINLSRHYRVNLHWFLTGKGGMFEIVPATPKEAPVNRLDRLQSFLDAQLKEIIQTREEVLNADVTDIPVTGEIAAGQAVESIDTVLDFVTVRKSVINGIIADYMCLRVNGHSMEPEIRHNDVVLIRQSQDWVKLVDRICAVRIDGSVTLKKLTLDDRRKYIVLVSINEEFQPMVINPEEHQDINLLGYLYFLYRKLS
ncbi:MAG: LexA family transcriptional regulator [Candidatus Cloacimonetes bacterium]|nr:LexA family transcriptional regulator [Candidatus Cloacimonadota bacterium]